MTKIQFPRVLAALTLATTVLASAATVQAALIAYEGFDYDPGNINALNGGSGWTTAWTSNSTTGSVVAGSLGYTDTNGNQLVVSGNSAVSSGQAASAQTVRDLPQTGAEGTTTWLSYIGQRLAPHDTDDQNLARAASLQIHDVGTTPVEKLAIGKGTTNPPSETNWSILHSGNVANAVYSSVPQLSQAFLVVRIDHIGDATVADNAWLWVNPLLDSEPDTGNADASFIGALDFSYDRIRVFAGNTSGGNNWAEIAYDEIRFGTEYGDVSPYTQGIPEPASALLGLLGLGLPLLQRRSR
jgi:hypothetical protein